LDSGFGVSGYFTRTFWRSWFRGSWQLKTIWNDIRPRNMGQTGIIFDPAFDPLTKLLWQASTIGTVAGTSYLGARMAR